jgi:hypothetical protein
MTSGMPSRFEVTNESFETVGIDGAVEDAAEAAETAGAAAGDLTDEAGSS